MRIDISFLRTSWPPSWAVSCQLFAFLFAQFIVCQLAAQQPSNAANVLAAPSGQASGPPVETPNAFGDTEQRGGAANADFDSLIDLIQSTVSTETWAENGGGEAEIRPFPGGVLIDAAGTLRLRSRGQGKRDLMKIRGSVRDAKSQPPADVRRKSALRFISLLRLEREITRRQAARQPLEPAMLILAGLERVRFVFVYPKSGDLVLAGPAGDWGVDPDGRIVSVDTRQPVVRLDDLLVLFRRTGAATSYFGCSINPRQDALAKTQAFVASTNQKPLQPGQRSTWLRQLRDNIGHQDITVFGVDPSSRVASVLVEADYHMKLVGMGLAESVDGVENYLDLVKQSSRQSGGSPPPAMSVLRWWFTLSYESIRHTEARDAFELVGQGVRVLSENEILAERGQRVHTGQSEPLNRRFAASFTKHFDELAEKYPVYTELRNIFDLAMAVAVIQKEGLAAQVGWKPTLFASSQQLRLPQAAAPRQVETVVNHRLINGRHIVAGVSGGVMVAPSDVLEEAASPGTSDILAHEPVAADSAVWWWDAPR